MIDALSTGSADPMEYEYQIDYLSKIISSNMTIKNGLVCLAPALALRNSIHPDYSHTSEHFITNNAIVFFTRSPELVHDVIDDSSSALGIVVYLAKQIFNPHAISPCDLHIDSKLYQIDTIAVSAFDLDGYIVWENISEKT